MALTIGAPNPISIGGRFMVPTQLTFDNSYPTGGYPLTGQQLGLVCGLVDYVDSPSTSGYDIFYNSATSKIQAYVSGGTEVSNATDLHLVAPTVVAFGR